MSMRSLYSVSALAASLSALALGAAAPAQALTITLSDTNCTSYASTADPQTGNVTISCATVTPPPPPTNTPPSGCTLTTSTSTASVGGSFSVNARCTAGDLPITFRLSGTGVAANTTVQQSSTAGSATYLASGLTAQVYSFSATAFNAVNANAPVNVSGTPSVTVSQVVVPPPTPGVISCASQGFAKTNVINLNWTSSTGNISGAINSWGANEALVVAFTTPALTSSRAGNITVYEFGGSPAYKTATLSASACDFGPGLGKAEGLTIPLYYTVGPNSFGYPALQPNTTYYYNVVNRQNGAESCFGNCAAKAELSKPRGL